MYYKIAANKQLPLVSVSQLTGPFRPLACTLEDASVQKSQVVRDLVNLSIAKKDDFFHHSSDSAERSW